jgi:hypothetical protein
MLPFNDREIIIMQYNVSIIWDLFRGDIKPHNLQEYSWMLGLNK